MIDANKLECLCLVFTIEWFIFSWYTVTGIKRHSLSENKIDDDIYACTMNTVHFVFTLKFEILELNIVMTNKPY